MDSPPGLRSKILLEPMKILDSLSSGNFSCMSKKFETLQETGIYKIKVIQITKGIFTLQKTSGYCRAVPRVYTSISC